MDAVCGVVIDIRKAFDTVDHCSLLFKIENLCIRWVALELLTK